MVKWVGYVLVGLLAIGGIGSMLGVEEEGDADPSANPPTSKATELDEFEKTKQPEETEATKVAGLADLPEETTTPQVVEPTPARTTSSPPKPRRTRSPKPPRVVEKTDPMFDTCGDANDAGYGNYVSGADREYGWYDDRDGDGVVCEF